MSLRARIVLLVMLAAFTPAVLFGIFIADHRNQDVAHAKHRLHALAGYAAKNFQDKVDSTVQMLHGLSRVPELDLTKAACSDFLGDVLRRNPQYTSLATILPNGQLHCDSLGSDRTLDLSDRAYFRQARGAKDPVFEVAFGRLTGIAVLHVAFPARDGAGKLKHVLLASLNLAQFAARNATAGAYAGIEMALWDAKGMLMARYPDDLVRPLVGSAMPYSALFRFGRADEGEETAELPGPDGSVKIWSRSVLPVGQDAGLRINLGLPRQQLLAESNKTMRPAVATLAAGTLLAFLGALLVAELGIRRQVARIMAASRRQGAGDPGARIGLPYPRGELGGLMVLLDSAAASAQAQQAEEKRTAEALRRSNRTLRMLNAINSMSARIHDREELLSEACRIAFTDGGFPIAWAGLLEPGSDSVRPVAWQGIDRTYVDTVPRSASDTEHVVGRALSTRCAVVINDIAADPSMVMGKSALAVGSLALAAFPLLASGRAIGVLVLHARQIGFFDEAELKLLGALAGDISLALESIEKSDRLEYLAYYDSVTGLANRALFLDRVGQQLRIAARGAHRVALMIVDVERFKNINDTLGRPAGDALLKQIGKWLAVGAGDVQQVARVGADQFAVVLPEVRQDDDVRLLLEKSIEVFLDHPFQLNESVFRIAIKVGAALFPDNGSDAEALFRNAEAALKKAKATGARYVFYDAELTGGLGKLALENQLREALEGERFVLHYQPKVSLATGRLVGMEALIRWNDPRMGMVAPDRFLPVLEETGLIHGVGRWALKKAIDDYLRWQAAGFAVVPIAVNISAVQLRSRGFAEEVRLASGMHPAARGGLELELKEGVIMEDVQGNIALLQEIRAMGVTVAIDNFGTGFSSLGSLSRLPADSLKIDRSFVAEMSHSPQGLALVSTLIGLAHSLDLKAVGDGVESDEQERLLRLLGCDAMQGHVFCGALPADAFEERFLALPAAA